MSALRSGSLVLVPMVTTGCSGVFWGNLGVLCVTVGIFLGTVFLTRGNRGATRVTASTSQRPATSASTSQHS